MNRRNHEQRLTFRRTAIAGAVVLMAGPTWAAPEASQVITITATKRAEDIQKVPLSVTAISGEDLLERGITDILSLDRSIPGLKIANAANDPSPIIRGAGVAGTTDIAVPFYVDGIYRPRSGQGLAS